MPDRDEQNGVINGINTGTISKAEAQVWDLANGRINVEDVETWTINVDVQAYKEGTGGSIVTNVATIHIRISS